MEPISPEQGERNSLLTDIWPRLRGAEKLSDREPRTRAMPTDWLRRLLNALVAEPTRSPSDILVDIFDQYRRATETPSDGPAGQN